MAPFSLSPATQRCLIKSLVLLLVLIAAPFITSYWQIHQWLAAEKCVLYNNHTTITICKARTHRPFVLNNTQLSERPPDIASLISTITKASKDATLEGLDKSLRTLDTDQQEDVYDYSRESWMRLGILPTPNNDPMVEETDTALGFRRNPNKQSMKHSNDSNKFPVATYFWLLLNVGLYGWYYTKRVDSSAVSINGQLLRHGGDFGRALSGNLAHFEILHLGVNGMSLLNLGQALEHNNRLMGGTIGLLLWTGSFLVLTAYWVVILYIVDRNVGARLWRRWSGTRPPSRFPSMVGFSGILFAWSVAWALSLSKFQQMCPFPGLCFSTHNVGGFKFSWGPIVQLVLIQALLHKKVSFVGHLAGTIVGFLWHWGLLLPLEWSQPCILYPILWMVGKCIIYRWSGSFEALAGGSQEQEHSFGSASHLGGGQVLGSGGSRWTYESDQDESDQDESTARTQLLYGVQKVLVVHAFLLLSVYGFGLLSPMVLSESLLLLIYVLFVRATVVGSPNDGVHPLRTLGIVGRAYVAFAVVAIVTDAMTMGGWLATLRWSETPWLVLVTVATRISLWVLSSSVVCLVLDSTNELQRRDGGIWSHVLGWSVAEPCLVLGKTLAKGKWKFRHDSTTTRAIPSEDSAGVTPGRSISNVAGKSRLLDRGTTSNRGVV